MDRIEFRETAMNTDCLIMGICSAKDSLIKQGLAAIGLSYEWAMDNTDRLNVISCGCTFGDNSEHYYIDNQLKFSICTFVDHLHGQNVEAEKYGYVMFLTFPNECNILPIKERCSVCLKNSAPVCLREDLRK